jgi:hypothetical protein
MDAWVNFAKGGTPQDGHGVDWSKYTEDNRDLVLIGNAGSTQGMIPILSCSTICSGTCVRTEPIPGHVKVPGHVTLASTTRIEVYEAR